MLSREQQKCLEFLRGPVLVLAGAGSGKTRVLVARFLQIVESGNSVSRILCVTFSNKAAHEIAERIRQSEVADKNLWVGTFHSLTFRLMQKFSLLNSEVSIIDERDQLRIFAQLNLGDNFKRIMSYQDGAIDELSLQDKEILRRYLDFCQENNMIDFSTILRNFLNFIETDENFREQVRSHFDFILVDEYQDTSKMQQKILECFLCSSKNIFAVGDDDQSIYGWRGAHIQNILNFRSTFPEAKIHFLENNFRSTKHIVDTANSLILHNRSRYGKFLRSDKEGQKVQIVYTKKEAQFIAEEILKLPKEYKIAILVRTIQLIAPLEKELMAQNISYVILGNISFFEKVNVQVVISYLRVVFLNDVFALERMFSMPKQGVGPKKIEKIREKFRECEDLLEAMQGVVSDAFILKLQTLKRTNFTPMQLVNYVYEITQMSTAEKDMLLGYANSQPSVQEFLKNIISFHNASNNRVSVMTIHASKGLEFDAVFIPGMIEGVFPSVKAIKENTLEEERRVAYVAFTRAKERLFLTYSLDRSLVNAQFFGPSRFLSNLPRTSTSFLML